MTRIKMSNGLSCADCEMAYHDFPDMVIPDIIWKSISPEGSEGGILCPTCICIRLRALGATAIFATPDNHCRIWGNSKKQESAK